MIPVAKEGFIRQISNEEYHSDKEYIGSSALKKYKRSPLHYKEQIPVETAALNIGSAYHCFILEPERFKKEYYILDEEKRPELEKGMTSNKNKAWKYEILQSYPQVIDIKQLHVFNAMKQRLFEDFYIKLLFNNGEAELSFYTEVEGAKVKVRPDYLKDNVIVDLKTTNDASEDGFKKSLANYDYHIQAALYTDVIEKVTGKKRKFIFIAQEKDIPFATNIFKVSPQMEAIGRYEYEVLLAQHLRCLESGKYRGYSIFADNRYGVTEIDLPAWKVKELNFYNK